MLVCSPLALGGSHFGSLSILKVVSLTTLGLLMADRYKRRAPLVHVPGLLPLLLLAAYQLFQLIPLPATIVALISPSNYHFHQQTLGLVEPMAWIPLTLNTQDGLSELFRQCAYIAFYVVSVQLLANRRHLKTTLGTVTVFTVMIAFIAIVGRFSGSGSPFGIDHASAIGFSGPLVNPDPLTGLLVVMLPLTSALFFLNRPPIRYQAFLKSVVEMVKAPRRHPDALVGLSAGLAWIAVLLSRSWSGMIAGCFSIGLLHWQLSKRYGLRSRIMPLALGAGLFFMMVSWCGEPLIDPCPDRVVDAQGESCNRRSAIWSDSLKIVADFPVTGTGIGTFGDVYPNYQSFSGRVTDTFAPNDYLALLGTGGMIAVFFMGWFMVSVLRSTYAAFRQRRDSTCRFLYLGAIAGLAGMGTHSLLDANLQVGNNGLYFFFLFSLLVSAAHTRLKVPHPMSTLEEISIAEFKPVIVLATGVLAFCLLNVASINAADRYFQAVAPWVESEPPDLQEREIHIKTHLEAAARWNPLEYRYPLMLARMAEHVNDVVSANRYYFKALRSFPISSDVLLRYGSFLGQNGQAEKAEQMLLAAIRFARQHPPGYQAYAKWLVENNRTDEAMQQMREAITRSPAEGNRFIEAMAQWGLPDAAMQASIPDLAGPCLAFAEYVAAGDNINLAAFFYQKAAVSESKAEQPVAGPFFRAYRFYVIQDRWVEALQILQQGVQTLPKNVKLRLTLANAYEHQGITYRAEEEYRQALIIAPGDPHIKAEIDRLVGS